MLQQPVSRDIGRKRGYLCQEVTEQDRQEQDLVEAVEAEAQGEAEDGKDHLQQDLAGSVYVQIVAKRFLISAEHRATALNVLNAAT